MTERFTFRTLYTSRGKQLSYLLSTPKEFEAGRPHPTLLALPPGEQTRELALVYEPWLPYFRQKGWVVCSPITPDGKLFFQGPERYLPQIMDHIEEQVTLAGRKFYLFGVSNGGISAFRVATLHPTRFHSITVLPGWPKPADEKRLDALMEMPVNFLVGELDDRWLEKSEVFHDRISSMGGDSSLEVIPGQGHIAFQILQADRLIEIVQRNVSEA